MSISTSDGCPRCGGTIDAAGSEGYECLNATCSATWVTERAYERECIARDLAGTRKMRVGPEYVDTQMKQDVTELVALVEYTTYENVLRNLRTAVDGRKTEAYRNRHGRLRSNAEAEALQSMYNWVLKQSEKYGEDNNENTHR